MKKTGLYVLLVLAFFTMGITVFAEGVDESSGTETSQTISSIEELERPTLESNETADSFDSESRILREQYESDYRKDVMSFDEYVKFITTMDSLDNSQFNTPEVGISPFSVGSERDRIVAEAKKHLGKPYTQTNPTRLGPNAFDCSGLAYYVFKTVTGRDIDNVTWKQEYKGTMINVSDAKPGDLIFWGERGKTYHVAIYIGNNQYIHAPDFGKTVEISPFWWKEFPPSFAIRMDLTDVPPVVNTKDNQNIITYWYENATSGSYKAVINYATSKNIKYRNKTASDGRIQIILGSFNQADPLKFELEKFLARNNYAYVANIDGNDEVPERYEKKQTVETYWYTSESSGTYRSVVNYMNSKGIKYSTKKNYEGNLKIVAENLELNSNVKFELEEFLANNNLNYTISLVTAKPANTKEEHNVITGWYESEVSGSYKSVAKYVIDNDISYRTEKRANGNLKFIIGPFNQADPIKFKLEKFLAQNNYGYVAKVKSDTSFPDKYTKRHNVEIYWFDSETSGSYQSVVKYATDRNFNYKTIKNANGKIKIIIGDFYLDSDEKIALEKFLGSYNYNYDLLLT